MERSNRLAFNIDEQRSLVRIRTRNTRIPRLSPKAGEKCLTNEASETEKISKKTMIFSINEHKSSSEKQTDPSFYGTIIVIYDIVIGRNQAVIEGITSFNGWVLDV